MSENLKTKSSLTFLGKRFFLLISLTWGQTIWKLKPYKPVLFLSHLLSSNSTSKFRSTSLIWGFFVKCLFCINQMIFPQLTLSFKSHKSFKTQFASTRK